jgi:hypothetical protein
MDSFPVKGVVGTDMDRSCKNCHSSWMMVPTNQDVKKGVVEGSMYCCDKRAHVQLTDGVYPRLTAIVREQPDLCGTKGKWFVLLREIPDGPLEGSVKPVQQRYTRPPNGTKPQYVPNPNRKPNDRRPATTYNEKQAARKPYKVA